MSGGFDNMLHFVGVVEDSHDLTNSGRVRVRAFGIHPPRDADSTEDSVPMDYLPWATVLDGTYGASPIIPSVGDWVFGFFIDGTEAQQPIIIGRLPGMNLSFPAGSGEPGEDGYTPPEAIHTWGEPHQHRYVTGEDAGMGQANVQRTYQRNNIETADGSTFSEPPVMMPETNFNNRVVKSKDGDNFIVLGSSEDGEAGDYFLISHSSGSVVQIDANGTVFIKAFGDKYNSTEGCEATNVQGSSDTNIQEDYTLKVGKTGTIKIQGNLDIECNDFNVRAARNVNIHAGMKTNISGAGIGLHATADDINMVAQANLKAMTNLGGMYFKCLMPGNIAGDGGDFHVDSYKTNMYSLAYTKIHSTGTPAISSQILPYPDVAHLGVDISSKTSLRIDALATMNINALGIMGINSGAALGIKSIGTLDIHSTAQLGLGAGALVNLDGLLVNIGNGTASATGGLATGTVTTSLAPQIVQSALGAVPNISVTELAAVVKPPEITNSLFPKLKRLIERLKPIITGVMGSGDNLD